MRASLVHRIRCHLCSLPHHLACPVGRKSFEHPQYVNQDRELGLTTPGGGRILTHSTVCTSLIPLRRSVRNSFTLEIRMVGKLEVDVDWRRLEVMYSSSWSGRNTHASWKNGFSEFFSVDRSNEWVGDAPIKVFNEASYCKIVNSFGAGERILWEAVSRNL